MKSNSTGTRGAVQKLLLMYIAILNYRIILNLHLVSCYNCFEMTYPYIFGGGTGDSEITSVSISYSYDFFLGGGSSDSSLTGVTNGNQTPFIAYIDFQGLIYFIKTVSQTLSKSISSITHSVTYSRIAYLLDSSPLTFVVVDFEGTLIGKYSTSNNKPSILNAIYLRMGSDQYSQMVVPYETDDEMIGILNINLNAGTINTQSKFGLSSKPTSIQYSSENQVYIGGYSLEGTSRTAMIFEYNYHYSQMIEHIAIVQGQIGSSFYDIAHFDSNQGKIYGCSEYHSTSPTTGPNSLLFFSVAPNSSPMNSKIFEQVYSGASGTSCKAAQAQSSQLFVYMSTSDAAGVNTAYLKSLKINTLSELSGLSTQIVMDAVGGGSFQMNYGVILSGYVTGQNNFYYFGKLSSIGYNIQQSFTYSQGFIMQATSTQSCVSFSYSTPGNTLSSFPSSFQSLPTYNMNTTHLTFTTANVTISQNITFQNNNQAWCPIKYPISFINATFTNFTLYMGSYHITPPVLNETCDDINGQVTKEVTYYGNNSHISCIWASADSFVTNYKSRVCVNVYHANISVFTTNMVNWIYANYDIYITLADPCLGITFSPLILQDQTYKIGDPKLDYLLPDMQILSPALNSTACYVSKKIIAWIEPNSSVIFINSDLIISNASIVTNDNTLSGIYTVHLYYVLTMEDYIYESSFNVTLQDSCNETTLLTVAIQDFSYDISEAVNTTISNQKWALSKPTCQDKNQVAYSMSSNGSLTMLYQSAKNSITILTNSPSDVGTYIISVKGDLYEFNTLFIEAKIITFQLRITNLCPNSIVTTSNIIDYEYTIGNPQLFIPFQPWSNQYSYCGLFSYSSSLQNLTALPSSIVLNGTNNSFSVSSLNVLEAGVYLIQLTGVLPKGAAATVKYSLTFIDPCISATISFNYNSSYTYVLWQNPTNITYSALSSVSSISCGIMQYSVSTTTGDIIDSEIFTIVNSNQIRIYTETHSKHGSYTLKVTSWSGNYQAYSQSIEITVQILDPCYNASILSTPFSNPYKYNISDTPLVIYFSSFTSSLANCQDFIYTLTQLDSPISDSSFYSFDNTSHTISIFSNDYAFTGAYQFNLSGILPFDYGNKSELLTVIISCYEKSIESNEIIQTQYYQVGGDAKYITFSKFAVFPYCGNQLYYSVKESPNVVALISVEPIQPNITVQTSNVSLVGTYAVVISGKVNQTTNLSKSVLSYTLVVQEQNTLNNIDENNTAPYFVADLPASITILVGNTFSYTLPSQIDEQKDSIVMEVLLGSTTSFVKYSNNIFLISPTLASQKGTYPIYIKLTDKSTLPKSNLYQVNFIVSLKPLEVLSKNSTITDETINETDYSNTNASAFSRKIRKKQNSSSFKDLVDPLTAQILSVSQRGVVTVQFSSPLSAVSNLTSLSQDSLNISFINQNENQNSSLVSWNVTYLKDSEMLIDLNFSNQLYVSVDVIFALLICR